jgi:hypothetical protein
MSFHGLYRIDTRMIEHTDVSVVVKNRAQPPCRGAEIYRAGRTSPIDHSRSISSMTEANRAGKAALQLMLSEAQS